jgi:hypothetical protein
MEEERRVGSSVFIGEGRAVVQAKLSKRKYKVAKTKINELLKVR